jgi:tetratricopeptide (TPR) repeat protein
VEDFSSTRFAAAELLQALPYLYILRGRLDLAKDTMEPFQVFDGAADLQERASYAAAAAMLLRTEGKFADALARGNEALEARGKLGPIYPGVKMGFIEALEAAFALEDLDEVRGILSILDELRAGDTTPFQRAQGERFGARLAAATRDLDRVEPGFKSAAGLFREIGTPFWLGQTLLEHGEWLVSQDRADDAKPLSDEAREIFERLGAAPWTDRAGAPAPAGAAAPR